MIGNVSTHVDIILLMCYVHTVDMYIYVDIPAPSVSLLPPAPHTLGTSILQQTLRGGDTYVSSRTGRTPVDRPTTCLSLEWRFMGKSGAIPREN